MAYSPNLPAPKGDSPDLSEWLKREFLAIARQMQVGADNSPMRYLGALPTRPQDGLYLFAAGVAGATRGLYRYDSNGATYKFIG